MKSEKLDTITLGTYDFREGGSIYIPIGINMQCNTENSTQVREMYHLFLNSSTCYGVILSLLDMERINELEDSSRHARLEQCTMILSARMQDIQEIYANTMELLWIQEYEGPDAMKQAYENKPEIYKVFCGYFAHMIADQSKSYLEKRQMITWSVKKAVDSIFEDDHFWSSFEDPVKLLECLSDKTSPADILTEIINAYKNGIPVEDGNTISIWNIQDKISKYTSFKNADGVMKAAIEYISKTDNYQKEMHRLENRLLEHIKVFDSEKMKVLRLDESTEEHPEFAMIIKCCLNLDNPSEDYYMVFQHVVKGSECYCSREITHQNLENILDSSTSVAIPFAEYNDKVGWGKYIPKRERPLFVIIDSYPECKYFLENQGEDGQIYIGDLYDKSVYNSFTIMFFQQRKYEYIIFVFPTVKCLAETLIDEVHMTKEVLFSKNENFLKIFSCLGNEIQMMESMIALTEFIVGMKRNMRDINNPVTMLLHNTIANIAEQALKMRPHFYYRYWSSLPNDSTPGEPFYIRMLFENGENSGKICSESQEQLPLFFRNKEEAEIWQRKSGDNHARVVGVDRRFWKAIKSYLEEVGKQQVLLCLDVQEGKAVKIYNQQLECLMT